MHLESVRLLFRARLGVDTADVLFRIRIGSSSHESRLTTTSNNAGINESRFLSQRLRFVRRWQIPGAPFFFVLFGRKKRVARMSGRTKPSDHFHQFRLSHRRTTGRGAVHPAPDMKENGA